MMLVIAIATGEAGKTMSVATAQPTTRPSPPLPFGMVQREATLVENDKSEAAADMKMLAELARCRLAELGRPSGAFDAAVRRQLGALLDALCCGLQVAAARTM